MCQFYRDLNSNLRYLVDASAGGSIFNRCAGDAMKVIEEMALNSYQWPIDRQPIKRVNQVEGVEALTNVFKEEMGNLSKQITDCMKAKKEVHEAIRMRNDKVQVEYPPEEINYAGEKSHMYARGPSYLEYEEAQRRNAINQRQRGYNNWGRNNNYGGNPSLSYGNPNNFLQAPPGFSVTNGVIDDPKNMSIEKILKDFMDYHSKLVEAQGNKVEKLEGEMVTVVKQLRMLEVHLGQIASSSNQHQKGKLPSTTEVNPKGQLNAIHLISGTSYNEPPMPKDGLDEENKATVMVENDDGIVDELTMKSEKEEDPKHGRRPS